MRLMMIISKRSILFFLLLFSAVAIFAETGTIKGKIVDSVTGEPLIGASVLVESTSNGVATDIDGNYVIRNVSATTHNLVVTYVAYKKTTITNVVVEANKETVVDIKLVPDNVSLGEVEVVAQANRESENILLMEQKENLVATQAVGAKELSRKGIGDAQAAVAQVSGISRQEGVKNVFVRGLGDRYNATLLNGFPIPSEDPEYKNIALEFFGTDVIQTIDVNKAFSGRNSTDVGGAIININSKKLNGRRVLSAGLSSGANTAVFDTDFRGVDGMNYWGISKTKHPTEGKFDFQNSLDPKDINVPMNTSFGISAGNRFYIGENKNPLAYYAVFSHSSDYSYTNETVRSISMGEEAPYQDETGQKYSQNSSQLAMANLIYKLNKKHSIEYNFMMLHATNAYQGEYGGIDAEKNQDPPYEVFFRRQQINDNTLFVNQLQSAWTLSDKLALNVGASYNHIKGLEPDRRENFLRKGSSGEYSLMASNRQKRFFSELKENDFNVKIDARYYLNDSFDKKNSFLTFAYNGRFVDDKFNSIEYNYDAYNPNVIDDVSDLKLDEIYNESNMDNGYFDMTKGEPNSYDVSKYIHSGYLEGNYQFTERFTANAGFRMDYVDMTVDYVVDHASPGSQKLDRKYYYLPSLNLRYDINEKNSLRLSASKTYTLPQSKEISPYRYVDIGYASQGNANLKPSDNYNLDVKWDYYMSPTELISFTAFYKYITDPIARVEEGNSAGVLRYDNISDKANVGGLEVELRKNLFNNSSTMSDKYNRLSLGINGSYIFTRMDVASTNSTTRNSQLEGAAPFIVNCDVSYNYSNGSKNLVSSLVFNYFSERIHTIGMLGYRDIVEEGVGTLNFVTSYKFNDHFGIKLSASNLLNPSYTLYRKRTVSDEKVIVRDFKKGVKISLGISYDL